MNTGRPDDTASSSEFVAVDHVGSVAGDQGVGSGRDGDVGFDSSAWAEEEEARFGGEAGGGGGDGGAVAVEGCRHCKEKAEEEQTLFIFALFLKVME